MPRRTARLVLAFSCLALVAAGPASQAPKPLTGAAYHALLQQARGATAAGDAAMALEAWARLAASTPRSAEAWLGLAQAALALGDFPRALQSAERALEIGTDRPAGLAYRVATAYARAGRSADAYRLLRRALDLGLEDRAAIWEDEAFARFRDDPELRELAARPEVEALGRVEGWRADLEVLRAEAARLHAAPRSPARGEAWATSVDELAARVAELDDTDVVLEVARLLAALGDGHSQVRGQGNDRLDLSRLQPTLPVRFHQFAGGARIIAAAPEHESLVGARVLEIGALSVDEALEAVAPYLSRDNDTWLAAYGLEHLLVRAAYLERIDALDDDGIVPLRILTDGVGSAVELRTGEHDLTGWPVAAAADGPAFLALRDLPHRLESMPELGAAYLLLNAVADVEGGPTLRERTAELRELLATGDHESVILDLRLNGGGDNSLIDDLVRTLVWFEGDDPEHRIFVITGPRTFSAAQNLANRIDALTDATFVGQPTGSRPNFAGEVSRVLLPWSGLEVSVASRYWQDSGPLDHRPWIFPDVPVEMSWTDWIEGVDPALREIGRILERP